MEVLGVIPARYGSTRFPGKPLVEIAGTSLIRRVWDQVSRCSRLTAAVVATDDERIFRHVEEFGGRVLLTDPGHPSGTDRIGEVAGSIAADYYVNIQGDEPLLPPEAIDALVSRTIAVAAPMSTLVTPLDAVADAAAIADPNVVKVVRGLDDAALYFSRSALPYDRDGSAPACYKHIGIYMYSRLTLDNLCTWERTPLERAESLEQLRALEHGVHILCVETDYSPVGVDTPEDVARVEQRLVG